MKKNMRVENRGKEFINSKKVGLFFLLFLVFFFAFLIPQDPSFDRTFNFNFYDILAIFKFVLVSSLIFLMAFAWIGIFCSRDGFLELINKVETEKRSKFFPHLIFYLISIYSFCICLFFLYTYAFKADYNSVFLEALAHPFMLMISSFLMVYKSIYRVFLINLLYKTYLKLGAI